MKTFGFQDAAYTSGLLEALIYSLTLICGFFPLGFISCSLDVHLLFGSLVSWFLLKIVCIAATYIELIVVWNFYLLVNKEIDCSEIFLRVYMHTWFDIWIMCFTLQKEVFSFCSASFFKVENLLISNQGTIKLCDFGSATTVAYYPDYSWSAQKRALVEEEVRISYCCWCWQYTSFSVSNLLLVCVTSRTSEDSCRAIYVAGVHFNWLAVNTACFL